MQLDEQVLLNCGITGLVKNALFLCVISTLRSVQHEHLTLSLSLSYVQTDFFSFENRAIVRPGRRCILLDP